MIGTMKPAEIRARIRKQSGLSGVQLSAVVEKQIVEADEAVAESLRLFRDALLRETKRKVRRPSRRDTVGAKK